MITVLMLLYSENVSQIWNGGSLSEPFKVEQGVKQGCLLSPILFSLFLNDLHDSLPGGIQIGNTNVKVIMYADDIVLLSTCPNELQQMIDALSVYCRTWSLSVNLEKSKILVFREGPRLSRSLSWTYNNSPIEIVNEYKYLGVLLTYNMSFRKHLSLKLESAKNALNSAWSGFILDPKIDVGSKLKIFDAAARSIMFYGAQVWGFLEYDEVERLLRYFAKRILNLPRNTPNYMITLETRIDPLNVSTLSLHLMYINKVINMPAERLPRILAQEIFNKKIFWAVKLCQLYNSHNFSFPTVFEHLNVTNEFANLLDLHKRSQRETAMQNAANGRNHDLYHLLDYNIQPYVFDQLPLHCISLFFRARGGLLNLNANPFVKSFTDKCCICNLNVKEDIFHFIAICPIYTYLRHQYLGKQQLSMAELVSLLNGYNICGLYEFLSRALKYRNLILNEYS